jgi:hypothetical protein
MFEARSPLLHHHPHVAEAGERYDVVSIGRKQMRIISS